MTTRSLDLNVVRAFVAVAQLESFTKAAECVGRTQSAISMKIQKLEFLLGKQLFLRSPGSVRLTAEGRRFLDFAVPLMTLQNKAFECLGTMKDCQKVRIGTEVSFAVEELPPALYRYREVRRTVEVEISCGLGMDVIRNLETGICDIGLFRCPIENAIGEILWLEQVTWAGPRNLHQFKASPIPLVAFPEGSFMRHYAIEALDRVRYPWTITHSSGDTETVRAAVASGLGIGALPSGTFGCGLLDCSEELGLPSLPQVAICLAVSSCNPSEPVCELSVFLKRALILCLEHSAAASRRAEISAAPVEKSQLLSAF